MFKKLGGFAVIALMACAGTQSVPSSTPTPAPTISSIAGEYVLFAVDGNKLPFAPKAAEPSALAPWAVLSGTLSLESNGLFRIETKYNSAGETAENDLQFTGACYPDGNEVRMVWEGGGLTSFTVRGDTIVLTKEGAKYSYVRR